MITKRTVLVLGAGASKEYGYPLGFELTERILSDLGNAPGPQCQMLQKCGVDAKHISDFVRSLKCSQRNSIDTFLKYRPEFARVGKLAIAQVLVPLEVEAVLLAHRTHLYRHILSCLTCDLEEFKDNQLSVVTFNYDRSFERFMQISLKECWPITSEEANDLVMSIPEIHMHGSLGHLPGLGDLGARPYGEQVNSTTLSAAAENIKTVHESKDAGDVAVRKAQRLLRDAERVFFLGLGYDALNLDLLEVKTNCAHKDVCGTSQGFQATGLARVSEAFSPARIELHSCDTVSLFGTNWDLV